MIEEPEKYCEKLFAQSYAFFFFEGSEKFMFHCRLDMCNNFDIYFISF